MDTQETMFEVLTAAHEIGWRARLEPDSAGRPRATLDSDRHGRPFVTLRDTRLGYVEVWPDVSTLDSDAPCVSVASRDDGSIVSVPLAFIRTALDLIAWTAACRYCGATWVLPHEPTEEDECDCVTHYVPLQDR